MREPMPSIRRGTIAETDTGLLSYALSAIMFLAPALRLRNLRIADFYQPVF